MAKYDPLKEYLLSLPKDKYEITLSFEQVEKIIEEEMPHSAYVHRAWWSNEENGVHVVAHAWMDAGWRVDPVNQKEHWVRFVRKQHFPQVKPKNLISIQGRLANERSDKKTMYTANRPVKTLVIHKPECRVIPWDKLSRCGCGDTGELGNQRWFCETHIMRQSVDEFMHGRFWAILMCDICFGRD